MREAAAKDTPVAEVRRSKETAPRATVAFGAGGEVMTLTAYSDLLEWAQGRPWWQQHVLAQLAAGVPVDGEQCAGIAAVLLGELPSPPAGGWLASMPQPVEVSAPPVRLVSIRDVEHVNRLAADQVLTFGEVGVTVIFGHNGSGKSGYARLIRQMVRTRHRDEVLPDIFERTMGPQQAVLTYAAGDQIGTADFRAASPSALAQVTFYDERCGDSYVTAEAEVTYRPPALRLMDDLILVCGRVRAELERLLAENSERRQALPQLPDDSESGQFLSRLSWATADADIESACTAPPDSEAIIEGARDEEARLRATDPDREKARLSRLAGQMATLADHLEHLDAALGSAAEAALRDAASHARQMRAAADLASSASFDGEPLTGVGSLTWQALWEAARAFSETTAYPAQPFPVTEEGARCVLCQQALDGEARQRLDAFEAYVTDHTEHQAREADRNLQERMERIRSVQVRPAEVHVALLALEDSDPHLAQEISSLLDTYNSRLSALADTDMAAISVGDTMTVLTRVRDDEQALRERAEGIDASDFSDEIARLAATQRSMTARLAMRDAKAVVFAERDRLKQRHLLEEAMRETDTRGITRTASELTRTHVTVSVQDRFSRESQMLGVERVTLLDKRGQRGVLLHRPEFIGATVRAELPQVLSEGEQTALGLAGYFVDAYFDTTKSALVLDDPVTSLDHVRRDKVARRLVEFARDRQVIVFTHDMSFVGDLRRTAEQLDVAITERGVERRRSDEVPGVCMDAHPWTARDTKGRIHDLKQDLARMRRESAAWDGDRYEREVSSWASRLSQTWERLVSQEIAGRVVDISTLEVKITNLKIAAGITPEDNKILQESYHRCSGWTRHDQNEALNYVPPNLDDLERELLSLEAWYRNVKSYANAN